MSARAAESARVPRVIVVAELPRTPAGNVNRQALREREAGR